MSKGLLIHNPQAGKGNAALLPALIAALGEVVPISFDELGNLKNTAQRARDEGCDWVAVAGGDGTVEGVAEALIGTNLPLGVIPAGTYNNFARSLDLPIDAIAACAIIKAGKTRQIDIGLVNGHPFFEVIGCGLDAALYPLGEEIKSGRFHLWLDLFHKAAGYERQKFQLTLDRPIWQALANPKGNQSHHLLRRLARNQKSTITLSALMLTISNGPYFGMNFAIAPEQRVDDGLLTVTIFSRYSKLQLWWHFFSIAGGKRDYAPKTITLRVAGLKISGPKKVPVQLDGTLQENLWPLDITCRPGSLLVFR